jgi:hypothetical protein
MLCLLGFRDHNWFGQGWSSHRFDPKIPEGVLRSYFKCARCGKKKFVDETPEIVQARFDSYNNPDFPDIITVKE